MLLDFEGLAVWAGKKDFDIDVLAWEMLKALLFSTKKKCQFLNDLDKNRFSNFHNPIGATHNGAKDKGFRDVRINLFNLIICPEDYVHIFCKLQRKLVNHQIAMLIYYPLAFVFYAWIRVVNVISRLHIT